VCAAFDPENKQSTARLHNFGCYCEGFFKTAINRSPQNLSVLYTRPLLVPALFRSWLHLPAIRQWNISWPTWHCSHITSACPSIRFSEVFCI